MALIKHANSAQLAREAIVLDLGDLSRQGQQLIETARSRADQHLAEARAERERIITGAAEKGHAEGLARGLEEGRRKGAEEGRAAAAAERKAQLEKIEQAWTLALQEFSAQRDHMLADAHTEVLRLALLIAQKVTKRAIEANPRTVEDQMRAVLATVTRPTELALRVCPDDLEIARAALPGLITAFEAVRSASIGPDPALSPGSCIATTRGGVSEALGGGEIDASIDTQLARIIEALLPGAKDATEPAPGAGA